MPTPRNSHQFLYFFQSENVKRISIRLKIEIFQAILKKNKNKNEKRLNKITTNLKAYFVLHTLFYTPNAL